MKKKTLINLIHLNFITGMIYAAMRFLNTSRLDILPRRLWAFEFWIIFGFYSLFLVLVLRDKDEHDHIVTVKWLKNKLKRNSK